MAGETVLVTGGSGFVGAHVLVQLLAAGYRVRTTVRSLSSEPKVRALLKNGGADPAVEMGFFAADLMSDAGWQPAVDGCDFVLHVASPFPTAQPKDENELIIPARDGALRVLRSARHAGVKRVVLTSSFAAVGYGHEDSSQPFAEDSWTNVSGAGVTPYVKSKTFAERVAWDFIRTDGAGMELSVVNPVAIFGPVLGPDFSSSVEILNQLLAGRLSRLPQVAFGVVDVRDVADLHLRAMTNPAAAGERFLATSGVLSLLDGARILKERLGPDADKISTKSMPDWMVRIAALVSPQARDVLPQLGHARSSTSEKARRVLEWEPRSREDAIVATGESLVRLGLVRGH